MKIKKYEWLSPEEKYIRRFIKTDKYDNIIEKAIKNHNKARIEDGLQKMR